MLHNITDICNISQSKKLYVQGLQYRGQTRTRNCLMLWRMRILQTHSQSPIEPIQLAFAHPTSIFHLNILLQFTFRRFKRSLVTLRNQTLLIFCFYMSVAYLVHIIFIQFIILRRRVRTMALLVMQHYLILE
jgi:hypothetical protein